MSRRICDRWGRHEEFVRACIGGLSRLICGGPALPFGSKQGTRIEESSWSAGRLVGGGAGLFAEGGGSVEQGLAGGFGVGGLGDRGEVEVPLYGVVEVRGDGGGGEVDHGVFVEGGLGVLEFVDVLVAGFDELDVVAAVEGEACFDGGGADVLVVEEDAGAGWGGGDADFALDAGGEGEEEEGQ